MNYQEYKKQGKKTGALKRKLGIKKDEVLQPGDLLKRAQGKKLLAIKGII